MLKNGRLFLYQHCIKAIRRFFEKIVADCAGVAELIIPFEWYATDKKVGLYDDGFSLAIWSVVVVFSRYRFMTKTDYYC